MLDRMQDESERSFWIRMHLHYTLQAEKSMKNVSTSSAQVYAILASAAATRILST